MGWLRALRQAHRRAWQTPWRLGVTQCLWIVLAWLAVRQHGQLEAWHRTQQQAVALMGQGPGWSVTLSTPQGHPPSWRSAPWNRVEGWPAWMAQPRPAALLARSPVQVRLGSDPGVRWARLLFVNAAFGLKPASSGSGGQALACAWLGEAQPSAQWLRLHGTQACRLQPFDPGWQALRSQLAGDVLLLPLSAAREVLGPQASAQWVNALVAQADACAELPLAPLGTEWRCERFHATRGAPAQALMGMSRVQLSLGGGLALSAMVALLLHLQGQQRSWLKELGLRRACGCTRRQVAGLIVTDAAMQAAWVLGPAGLLTLVWGWTQGLSWPSLAWLGLALMACSVAVMAGQWAFVTWRMSRRPLAAVLQGG